MQYTRSFLRSYILITVLLLFFDVNHAQDLFVFHEHLSGKIDQVLARNISVADIDNDGSQDIILSGFDDLNRDGLFLDIYSVTGELIYTSTLSNITGSNINLKWNCLNQNQRSRLNLAGNSPDGKSKP